MRSWATWKSSLSTQMTLLNSAIIALAMLVEKYPGNTHYQRELSISYYNLGDVEEAQGNWTTALEYYKDSLKIAQKLVNLAPDNADYRLGYLFPVPFGICTLKGDIFRILYFQPWKRNCRKALIRTTWNQ